MTKIKKTLLLVLVAAVTVATIITSTVLVLNGKNSNTPDKEMVTYSYRDEYGQLQEIEVESGFAITLPTLENTDDEIFVGWKVKGTDDVITMPYVINGDVEFEAVYVAKPDDWTPIEIANMPESFAINYIWYEGDNIYYSNCSYGEQQHYVLNKSTNTWEEKVWTGLTDFSAEYVWTDGDSVYYSEGENHYELNKATSEWTVKEWTGLTNFNGDKIWTDGEHIYYECYDEAYAHTNYKLDKATNTWNETEFTTYGNTYGNTRIWSADGKVYNSYYVPKYNATFYKVWDKEIENWDSGTNLNGFYLNADCVWSDGENEYYSNGSIQFIFDENFAFANGVWTPVTWIGKQNIDGRGVWGIGDNIYYADYAAGVIYKLNKVN